MSLQDLTILNKKCEEYEARIHKLEAMNKNQRAYYDDNVAKDAEIQRLKDEQAGAVHWAIQQVIAQKDTEIKRLNDRIIELEDRCLAPVVVNYEQIASKIRGQDQEIRDHRERLRLAVNLNADQSQKMEAMWKLLDEAERFARQCERPGGSDAPWKWLAQYRELKK